jgi:hypothetical protein
MTLTPLFYDNSWPWVAEMNGRYYYADEVDTELARLQAVERAAWPFVKDFPPSVLSDKETWPDASDAPVTDFCFPTMADVRALAAALKGGAK